MQLTWLQGRISSQKETKRQSLAEFVRADALDQNRGEAKAALVALTPTPTPVTAPQVPRDVQAYFIYMARPMVVIEKGLNTITEKSREAGLKPTVIFTDSWRLDVAVTLAGLQRAGAQIQQYQPVPRGLETVDRLTTALGKDVVAFADDYAAGVDTLSTTRLNAAVAHLQSANAIAERANTELKRVALQYGISLYSDSDNTPVV